MMRAALRFGAAVSLLAAGTANAGSPPSAAVRAACMDDAMKLCGRVMNNLQARRNCMVEHATQLSESCKSAIAAGGDASKSATGPHINCDVVHWGQGGHNGFLNGGDAGQSYKGTPQYMHNVICGHP